MFKLFQLATRFCIRLLPFGSQRTKTIHRFLRLPINPKRALSRFQRNLTQKTWMRLLAFLFRHYLRYLYSRGLVSEKDWFSSVGKWLQELFLGFFTIVAILWGIHLFFYLLAAFLRFVRWLIRRALHPII